MANELTVNVNIAAVKGFLNVTRSAYYQATLNGTTLSSVLQSIPTTAGGTALAIASSVTTAGLAYFRNTDTTNYVTIGHQVSGTYYPILKLEPGEVAVSRLATLSLYALANTAAVVLEHSIVND
jgi:hypothetical protein